MVLLETNIKNSSKMAQNEVFITTERFDFMNLDRLRFRLWPNDRKLTKGWFPSQHYIAILFCFKLVFFLTLGIFLFHYSDNPLYENTTDTNGCGKCNLLHARNLRVRWQCVTLYMEQRHFFPHCLQMDFLQCWNIYESFWVTRTHEEVTCISCICTYVMLKDTPWQQRHVSYICYACVYI